MADSCFPDTRKSKKIPEHKKKSGHITMDARYAKVLASTQPHMFSHEGERGTQYNKREIMDRIQEYIDEGFDFIPHSKCDNVLLDGSCGGHI